MTASNQDFLLNSLSGDLEIQNGDFVVGNSIDQNIYDILMSIPGMWKQYPNMGCNLASFQDGLTIGLDSLIRKQLTLDGFTVNRLNINLSPSGELVISPNVSR